MSTTAAEELTVAALAYAEVTEQYRAYKSAYQAKYDAFLAENAGLIEHTNTAKREMEAGAEHLKWRTLCVYDETGNKKPGYGTGIRVETDVVWGSEADVLRWCDQHFPLAIRRTYDVKMLTNFVVANPDAAFPIASVTKVAKATLPADILAHMELANA